MKIEVNIEKKYVFLIIGVILLIGAGIFVYAYGTNNPSVFGHSISEVAPPAGCADGQVLSYNNSAWSCVNNGASSSGFSHIVFFGASGTWSVPAGVTVFRVRAWGGGAGGGGSYSTMNIGSNGGGGAGGYAEDIITIPAGKTSYTVTVGSGGAGGSGTTYALIHGKNGTSSSVDSIVIAKGGSAGILVGGLGGGGIVDANGFSINGGNGQFNGLYNNLDFDGGSSPGGGEGGTIFYHGGSGAGSGRGNSGQTPGGGGGGSYLDGESVASGGSGAPGRVIIEY